MHLLKLICKGAAPLVLDSDVQAFVSSASISDQSQKKALNDFVLGLKAQSLWTKMVAVYPFAGGTSSSHSYNLKNPSQYQLTYSGTPSHTSAGMVTSSSSYANTNMALSVIGVGATCHAGVVVKSVTRPGSAFGSETMPYPHGLRLYLSTVSGVDKATFGIVSRTVPYLFDQTWNDTPNSFYVLTSKYSELYSGGHTVNPYTGVCRAYTNGSLSKEAPMDWWQSSGTGAPYGNGNVYVGRINSTRADEYLPGTYAFCCFGSYLTGTEVSALNTLVQSLQTALGR